MLQIQSPDANIVAYAKGSEYLQTSLLLTAPVDGGKIFYKAAPNDKYYRLADNFGLQNGNATWTGQMATGVNEHEIARLGFIEKARPGAGKNVMVEIPVYRPSDASDYTLLPSTSTYPSLFYRDLSQTNLTYEPVFISERGSKCEDITSNRADLQFANEIVKTQWSVHDASSTTGVREIGTPIPKDAHLKQNYPNPFNPVTTIPFVLNKEANVSLKVYNLLGQEVATLTDERHMAGAHELRFDGSNLASGTYIYRLSVDGKMTDAKTLQLVK